MRNGADKTTTIRVLLGMYRADSGTMSVLGRDPAREAVALHRSVGYLPGELALHQRLTGAQHLAAFARARRMVDHALRDELVERFGVELDGRYGHCPRATGRKSASSSRSCTGPSC